VPELCNFLSEIPRLMISVQGNASFSWDSASYRLVSMQGGGASFF